MPTCTHVLKALQKITERHGWSIEKYVIAREEHEETGGNHYHAYMRFGSKINAKDTRIFDLHWEDAHYHFMHRGKVRSSKAVEAYCKKDGDWISNYELNTVWHRVMSRDVSVEQAITMISQEAPRDLAINGERIESNLKRFKSTPIGYKSKYTMDDFQEPPALIRWMKDQMEADIPERKKCLILLGDTGYGKTQWARTYVERHMYFRGHFNIDKWDPEAEAIIFDDIPWRFIPEKKSLLTHMGEAELTDKYRSKKTVFVTMPAIVLANDGSGPDEFMWQGDRPNPSLVHPRDDPYWQKRATIITLKKPLWRNYVPPAVDSE